MSTNPHSENAIENEPSSSRSLEGSLESYRAYLMLMAEWQVGARLRSKLDASDIVQQTMMKAHAGFGELRDRSPQVVIAWLRQILAHEIADTYKHFGRDRRNIAREKVIVAELDESAAGMDAWLAADQTSPSLAAQRNEEILRLSNALLQLPVDQREVILLKHFNDESLQQIAEKTGRSTASVAGLLRRGLAQLRMLLDGKADL